MPPVAVSFQQGPKANYQQTPRAPRRYPIKMQQLAG